MHKSWQINKQQGLMTVPNTSKTNRTMSPGYCSLFSVHHFFGSELEGPAGRTWFSSFRAGSQVIAETIQRSSWARN